MNLMITNDMSKIVFKAKPVDARTDRELSRAGADHQPIGQSARRRQHLRCQSDRWPFPCHRVVRSDGDLASDRWGIARKRALIQKEAAA